MLQSGIWLRVRTKFISVGEGCVQFIRYVVQFYQLCIICITKVMASELGPANLKLIIGSFDRLFW